MKNNHLPILICLMLLLGLQSFNLQAQKLPNVQKNSVYAPTNAKIDGKANEWGDKFEAMNSATSVFYTMANDADKLYLTLQLTDLSAITKILGGGFKLTVQGADKAAKPVIVTGMLVKVLGSDGVGRKLRNKDVNTDSLVAALNTQMNTNIKEIGVKGVADVTDTLISLYNEYGIRQAVNIDNKRALTCELAIPLKYISHLIVGDTFKYNFTLTGMAMGGITVVMNGVKQDVAAVSNMPATSTMSVLMRGAMGGDFQSLYNPTDFSGSYTLAKK